MAKGVAKMYGCKAAEKKETGKNSSKVRMQLLLSKEVILGHPCVPRVRLTGLAIRTEAWETGGGAGKGGGRGWYKAWRVNAGFHVVTCDLTATASHLLVSAVPWIRITVSKSPFFNKSWKVYVLSYHFTRLAYKLAQKEPPPPPLPLFLHFIPPLPSHLTPACYTVHY